MLQIVVIVLERAPGVIGRIDVDALHLPAIKREKRFEGNEVVAMDNQVLSGCFGIAVDGFALEKVKGDFGGCATSVFIVHPVQNRHVEKE